MGRPVQNAAFVTYVTVEDYNTPGTVKSTPTIAAGDFQISKDGGAFANLTNIPTVTPAATPSIKFDLTSTEMNAEVILILARDQTTNKEWVDASWTIHTD